MNSNLMKVTNKLKKFINFHKFIEINCGGLGVGSDIGNFHRNLPKILQTKCLNICLKRYSSKNIQAT